MAAPRLPERNPALQDVSLLVLQRGGDLVKRVLGVLAKGRLANAETDLSLCNRLVLVNLADFLFHGGEVSCACCAVCWRLVGAIAGIECMRIRFIARPRALRMPSVDRASTSAIILAFLR